MSSFAGTAGDDIFTGGIDNDTAIGGPGRDQLSGGDGADLLVGGAGADTLDGGAGDDTLYSGDQSPAFNLPYSSNPYTLPQLDTGTEVDNLKGGDGSDRIFAGYGDNVDGGADGSFGDYLYISFQGAPQGVTADFGLTTQTIGGGVITGIENISYVQGSQFDDNLNVRSATNNGYSQFTSVSGMDGNDTLTAGYYTGSMFGDAGNDVVDGRPSQYLDIVDGGDGDDVLYTNSNTFASAFGGAGDDKIYAHGYVSGGSGDDQIFMQWTYYPGYVYGDEGNDKIVAADTGNIIAGGSGADTLIGGSGADTLISGDMTTTGYQSALPVDDAGREHDSLVGGAGSDALSIGYGDDADGGDGVDTLRLSFAGAPSGVNFNTAGIVSGQPVTIVGGGVIQNIEQLLSLRGSEYADTLTLATQSQQLTVDAGGGDDVIISQSSSVSVMGGAGDDRFVSGPAADTFDGGDGVDTVDYSGATAGVSVDLAAGVGAGGDLLRNVEGAIGSGFADTLSSGSARGALVGGGGDDVLAANYGDSVDGGAGTDTLRLSLAGASAGVALDTAGIVSGQPANVGGGVIQNVETLLSLRGSEYADTLSLATQSQPLRVDAGGGDDVIIAHGSAVSVLGGAGDDRFVSGGAADTFDGGSGIDTVDYSAASSGVAVDLGAGAGPGGDVLKNVEAVIGSANADTLSAGSGPAASILGGAGDDQITGADSGSLLRGEDGDDLIRTGRSGFDNVNGNAGRDTIIGASSVGGWLVGGQGDDLIDASGSSGHNIINGNLGDDQLTAGTGGDTLRGGQGDDVIRGGAGADWISGDLGDDTIVAGASANGAADTIDGGGGSDVVDYSGASAGVAVDLAAGSGAGGGVLHNVEGVIGSGFADTLSSGADHATLIGGGGGDALSINYGDFADGGAGTDTLRLSLAAAPAGVDLDTTSLVSGQAVTLGGGVIQNVEALLSLRGSEYADTLTLGTQSHALTLDAGGGDDLVIAHASAVSVLGGAGDDRFVSGGAADTFDGGTGADTIDYGAATSGVVVDLGAGSGGGGDVLKNVEAVIGSAGADTLTSAADGGLLRGGGGDDLLKTGSSGFDDINGNAGADTIIGSSRVGGWLLGGQGDDLIDASASTGHNIINGNLGNDLLTAGSGGDTLRGGQGDDMIRGGAGADWITGDRGADTLTGGGGADVFHLAKGGGADVITDFHADEGDRLLLDAGVSYTVNQQGADTVVDLGDGDMVVLQKVQATSLTSGWILTT